MEDDEDEEEEEDEDEQVKKALKKVRKARDMVTTTQSNLEEALKKAKEKHLKALKEVLLKKTHTSTGLKKLWGEVATVIKTAKDEVKELQQLANRAKSVSGNSKSSRGSNKWKPLKKGTQAFSGYQKDLWEKAESKKQNLEKAREVFEKRHSIIFEKR